MGNALVELSNDLASAVERAGRSIVAVHGRARLTSSGVHWREGLVVTAEHGVQRDDEIAVTLPDGRRLPASLAGRDPGTDLAVLKVEATLPLPEFDSTEPPRPGNLALAVGRSAESGVNAMMGVISAVSGPRRTWRGGRLDQFIRLDMALHPASSGGVVVNARGQAVGVATSGLSRLSAVAIPLTTINRVVDELLAKGYVPRGYLGLGLHPVQLPAPMAQQLGFAEAAGLIVVWVEPDGPASRGGVLLGDVLLLLDGRPVQDTDDIQSALDGGSIGRPVRALLVRGGERKEIVITVGERPRRAE